jgi:GNAT superfamily N-acetyltransferase
VLESRRFADGALTRSDVALRQEVRLRIVPFEAGHAGGAAALFAGAYRKVRFGSSILPERHEDPTRACQLLADAAAGTVFGFHSAPSVAALEGDRLVGFLAAFVLPSFFGDRPGVICPIWANAATGENRHEAYQWMYAEASTEWIRQGYLAHAIQLFPSDLAISDLFFRVGFGMQVVDALRPIDGLDVTPTGSEVTVRQATREDLPAIVAMVDGLVDYLAAGPIFSHSPHRATVESYGKWMERRDAVFWLAEHDGQPIAYLRSEPPTPDVSFLVHDPGTLSISGAWTDPGWRSRGAATMILAEILRWGQEHDYARCSVDFESANILGSRLWLGHFEPVTYSLLRKVDERILTPPA